MQQSNRPVSEGDLAKRSEIDKVLDGFKSGWNEHDANMFASVFEEDADFTNVLGINRTGRTAVKELHEPLFKTVWKNSTLHFEDFRIRFLHSHIASVDVWWKLTGLIDINENPRDDRNGLIHLIIREQKDNWQIAVMHNMDLPGSKNSIEYKIHAANAACK